MYEDKFEIGQTIRSYDFEGRRDCYAEGEIVAIHKDCTDIPYYCYEIKVTRRVFANEAEENYDGGNVYVPMITTFDYEGRVELIETVNSNPFSHSLRGRGFKDARLVHDNLPCTEDNFLSMAGRGMRVFEIVRHDGEEIAAFHGNAPVLAVAEFVKAIEANDAA